MDNKFIEKQEVPAMYDIQLTTKDEKFPYHMGAPGSPTILVDHIEVGLEQVSVEGFVQGMFRLRKERMGQMAFHPDAFQHAMPERVYSVTMNNYATLARIQRLTDRVAAQQPEGVMSFYRGRLLDILHGTAKPREDR